VKKLSERKAIQLDEKTYETFVELLNSAKIIQDYLNDQVIQDSSKHLSAVFKLLNSISSTDLVDILERGIQDPKLDKTLLDPPKIGLGGLLKSLRDEDVQRGLGIMIALLGAIGKASKEKRLD
jgi:uncharacterized protein YjgD (DUF1641 family)